MVIDSLKNLKNYVALNPHFEKVVQYVSSTDITSLEPGKYPIDGDNSWANIMKAELKKEEDARMEVHNAYIDIQICIKGKETFGWVKREACQKPVGEYDPEKDILFFEDKATIFFSLTDGECAIFFPEDGHQPMVGEGEIHKCVIKIKA